MTDPSTSEGKDKGKAILIESSSSEEPTPSPRESVGTEKDSPISTESEINDGLPSWYGREEEYCEICDLPHYRGEPCFPCMICDDRAHAAGMCDQRSRYSPTPRLARRVSPPPDCITVVYKNGKVSHTFPPGKEWLLNKCTVCPIRHPLIDPCIVCDHCGQCGHEAKDCVTTICLDPREKLYFQPCEKSESEYSEEPGSELSEELESDPMTEIELDPEMLEEFDFEELESDPMAEIELDPEMLEEYDSDLSEESESG